MGMPGPFELVIISD